MNGHSLVSYLEQCDDKIYYQQLDLEKNQSKTKKTGEWWLYKKPAIFFVVN